MQRDIKRPTVIAIQFSKNEKHIIVTDINGEQSIIDKNDKDALHEAILEIANNKDLPEFNLSHITIGNGEVKSQTTSKEGLDIQDILTNPDKLKSTGIGLGISFLQNLSKYQR